MKYAHNLGYPSRKYHQLQLKIQIKEVQEHFNKINNTTDIIDSYILTLKVIHE